MWQAAIASLEGINMQVDYAEYKYKDTLLQQLVCVLVHLSQLSTPSADDSAILGLIRGKKHFLQRIMSNVEAKVSALQGIDVQDDSPSESPTSTGSTSPGAESRKGVY